MTNPTMSLQQIFDKSAIHLLTQNKRSLSGSGSCKYRGPNGLMCAAGPFIPDSIYTKFMEGVTITEIIKDYRLYPSWPKENVELLRCLQFIHDNHPVDLWPIKLTALAKELHLSTDAIIHHNPTHQPQP